MSSSNPPLTPVPRDKKTELAASQLLEWLQTLEPGTRLPPERELTRTLDVGRSTLREALNGLEMLGAVEIRHGQGVFVANRVGAATGHQALSRALSSGLTNDYLEARLVIEVALARLAAERRTQSDLEDLRSTLSGHSSRLNDGTSPKRESGEFHVLISRAAHNEILASLALIQAWHRFAGPRLRAEVELFEGFLEWELAQHQSLCQAIEAKDHDSAGQRMHEHVSAMSEFYKRANQLIAEQDQRGPVALASD